jgi:carotenoid 1,2-hydratase
VTAAVSDIVFPAVGDTHRTRVVLDERPGAYRWWYFDAISDDGETSLVAIFFVGSVFSPYYAARLARGEAPSPREHVAVNVALYRHGKPFAWAFSEYGAERLNIEGESERNIGSGRVAIAGSWFERRRDGSILVHIDERRTLTGKPLAGSLLVTPQNARIAVSSVKLASDRHEWRPVAPHARVVARFDEPGLAFDGAGYHDENWGSEPPARAMASWSWGRVHHADRTRIFFDTLSRSGHRKLVVFDSVSGSHVAWPSPRKVRVSARSWLLPVPFAFEAGSREDGRNIVLGPPRLIERAPFYARFHAEFPHPAGRASSIGLGEHVDFTRFSDPIVRRMIALRIARPDRDDRGLLP